MIKAPEDFINDSNFKKILLNGQTGLIYIKEVLSQSVMRYVSSHALIYVTKGVLQVKTNYSVTTVNPGQIIFMPIGIYSTSEEKVKNENFEAYAFFFDERLAKRFLGNVEHMEEKKEPATLVMSESDPLKAFLQSLLKAYNTHTEKNATNWKVLEFLNLIKKSTYGDQFIHRLIRTQNRKKYGIKNFMERHFLNDLKIEDYAHLTGRSISTFHRDFKRKFGRSPKAWLLEKRLGVAKQALRENSQLRVSDLANIIGYDNTSHFIKAFQQQFGITPKQYQLRESEGSTTASMLSRQ